MKGIDPAKCRYLRHASSELSSAGWENNPAALFRDNRIDIEDYQSILKRDQLDGYDYAISLVAFGGGRALFLGIYQIVERNLPFVTHPRYKEFNESFGWDCYTKGISGRSSAYHKLEFTDTLAEYSGRLVISWSGQRFIQNASYRREVVKIMEAGSVGNFPGYDNILLGRADFEELLNNPRANAQWHTALSKVGGVYLITTKEGEQYVGSAYGKGSLWQRWHMG